MAILAAGEDSPCRVFDANGVELKLVVWCDTETGEAVQLVKDDTVRPVSVRRQLRTHQAPLRVERNA